MDNAALARLYSRVDKLETVNRLRGGFDYPAMPAVWIPNVLTTGGSGEWITTSTTVVTMLNACVPMQNPKMAFRFYYRNFTPGTLAAFNITETNSGSVVAVGNTTSSSVVLVELHIDISPFFVFGQLANFALNGLTAGGGTFATRPEYIGGSWTPDAAVAF